MTKLVDGKVYCKLLSPQGSKLPKGLELALGRTDQGLQEGPLSESDY